jgi:hypothetical protein
MTNKQTDWRALCADLVQLDKEQPTEYLDWKKRWDAAVSRVSTALAQPEQEGVTDEEIAKCLVAAGVDAMEGESDGTNRMYWEGWNEQILSGIRAVIAADRARSATPTINPLPVAERPWEREGWCDAEGRCWWLNPCGDVCGTVPSWVLDGIPAIKEIRFYGYTHSLPHDALPVPQP